MGTGRSTAENYFDDTRERTICKICCGEFVAHKYYEYKYFKMPDDVCIWCYSRGFGKKSGLYWRWETMERALRAIANVSCLKDELVEYNPDCKCLTCYAKRTMEKVDGSRPQRPYGAAAKIAEVATKLPDDSGVDQGTTPEGSTGQSSEQVSTGV